MARAKMYRAQSLTQESTETRERRKVEVEVSSARLAMGKRRRRIDYNYRYGIRDLVSNQDFQREMATVRDRDGTLGTPSRNVAWIARIVAAAVHVRAGRRGTKDRAQRKHKKAHGDQSQNKFGVAVDGHLTFPRTAILDGILGQREVDGRERTSVLSPAISRGTR